MKKKIINKLIPILLIINTSLFIISFSISFTILFRPFYYSQIKTLNIEEESGYTYDEIKQAYDDVIDYTTLNKEFRVGNLKYSNEGKDHFHDCKILFIINFIICGISGIIIIIKKLFYNTIKFHNYSISFISSCIVLLIIIILLIISLIIGFDKFFELFHNIFFLGKENWLFDSNIDEVIIILPFEYFMNCAILIVSIISTISITLIIKEIYNKKKGKIK